MVISKNGIKQNPKKVEALALMRATNTWKELETLIGKMNWYRSFAHKYTEITKPIYDLNLSRTVRKFVWPKKL